VLRGDDGDVFRCRANMLQPYFGTLGTVQICAEDHAGMMRRARSSLAINCGTLSGPVNSHRRLAHTRFRCTNAAPRSSDTVAANQGESDWSKAA
jgi:hypothetical protein